MAWEAGAAAFLQAQLRSGIEVVLDTVRFDERIEGQTLFLPEKEGWTARA